MKLSEFRGKVVLLSFWGIWCGPCMAMIPQEKALAVRLKGKPFVLVGVNAPTNRDPSELAKAIEKNEITWRSFKNRRPGQKLISAEWKVGGWPTLYLIDHKGIIRGYWLGAPPAEVLDREIERLVDRACRDRALEEQK